MKLLAACSGGPDSMAMLDLLRQAGIELVCAHVNYQHRPTADRDEEIVKSYCQAHGIPLCVLKPVHTSGNFQDWARQVRYDFFLEEGRRHACLAVAVAHQEDDVLETYLFQKQRKMRSSAAGLKPWSEWKGMKVWRPLLHCTKADLHAYCLEKRIPFGLDESNDTDAYTRNVIRHSIVSKLSRQERDDLLFRMRLEDASWRALENSPLDLDDMHWIVLEHWFWKHTGVHLSKKEAGILAKALSKDAFVPVHGWNIERRGKEVRIEKEQERKALIFQTEEELQNSPFAVPAGYNCQRLALRPEQYPVTIRPAEPGDKIEMRYGHKSVFQYFKDKKVWRLDRLHWPVVEDVHGKVVFVWQLGAAKDCFSRTGICLCFPSGRF